MAHRIEKIEPESIAAECGLEPGDILRSINGEPVLDQVDYQFLTAQEFLTLEIEDAAGVHEVSIEKDADEPLGIVFSSTLMSRPRQCANHCVFCFIDQMPEGLRDSLYVKDDDWRLSLMMGNYITLTNLSDREFERIIARKASPLFISVHATDGNVRAQMLRNPSGVHIMQQLHRLADAGIAFHCQVVLCPGLNDGKVLDDTIETLAGLYPAAKSMAVVPVGLTRHREGLTELTPYRHESALQLVKQVQRWQERLLKEIGTRFVFPSDEFYCQSGVTLPEDEEYEGFPQLENGVGILRSFTNEYAIAHTHMDADVTIPRSVLIATGTSAAPFLRRLIEKKPIEGVKVDILPVENDFFGKSVTVAGLLTGGDLRRALKGKRADEILLSQAMLRHEDELFLDDDSRAALEASLGIPVHSVGCDGADFLYALQGELYTEE